MDKTNAPAFWWVNQSKTYKEEFPGGFIWAPMKNKLGRPQFHWDNVAKVQAGDFIFHYAKGAIRAVSRAKGKGYESQKELSSNEWSDDGWRVDSEYFFLENPLPLEKISSRLYAMGLDKGPINQAKGVNQGYLYELSDQAAQFLISRLAKDPAVEASGIDQRNIVIEPTGESADLDGLTGVFLQSLEHAAVRSSANLITRFLSAALSKRFIILTGLAGSGKTKLAQSFAQWITPATDLTEGDDSNGSQPNQCYAVVPVGADWTGNENILGYPDGLQSTNYVTTPSLELIRRASEPQNATVPHFLILDEMNLSHVERYFADLLSAIESGEEIPLYNGAARFVDGEEVLQKLRLPDNFFIIGTVNVDETTYMFSPKVLDRANVIEFRMEPAEMQSFLSAPQAPRLEELEGKGAGYGEEFVAAAMNKAVQVPAAVSSEFEREMLLFFDLLRAHNLEFGYRTAFEASRLVHFYKLLGGFSDNDAWFEEAMDAVIVQKFLPKLHGSRTRLEGLLWALAWACGAERGDAFATDIPNAGKAEDDTFNPETLWKSLAKKNADDPASAARYPISFDKVMRMWRKLVRDQFVNFAEA